MRDAIGNRITKGALVYWKSAGMIAKVEEVVEPTLSLAGGEQQTPIFKISLAFPVKAEDRGEEPQLGDFICVLDPRQADAIGDLMSRLPPPGRKQ